MKRFARGTWLSFDGPSTRMFVWPFEMMLRFNANIANALQESTVAWAERRQEAAEEAVDAFERLIQSRDLADAVTIQQEWLESSIRRFDEDINTVAKQGAKMSRSAASTAEESMQRTSDTVRGGTRRAEELAESANEKAETAESGEVSDNHGRHSKHREHGKRAA